MNCTSVTPQSIVVCRLCTKTHEYYVNIFISNESCEIVVEDAIQDLLGLPVAVGDGLPNVVCSLCLRKLIEFREFKNMCFKSATELRAYALGNDFLVPKIEDEDAADVETSRDTSSPEIKFLNDIQVTEVYITVPDEIAIRNVSHAKEELWPSENALVVKEEVNDGGNYTEGDVPVNALTSVAVDPLAVDTMVDCCNYIGGIPEVPETHLDNFVSGQQDHSQQQLPSNSSYGHMREEKFQFEYSTARCLVGHSRSGKIVKRKESVKPSDSNEISSSSNDLKQLKCDGCGENFRYNSDLRNQSIVHTGVELHRCGVREKTFSQKGLLRNHSTFHTDEKPFKCDVCGKNYTEKGSLKRHSVIHTGVKPFKCNVCGNNFTEKGSLKRHLVTHKGVKPFNCNVCGKNFTQKSNLMKHSIIHAGLNPLKCNVCGKIFTEKSDLKKHLVMHNGEKPFKCTVCGKNFSAKSSLNRHLVIHTGVKPFKCKVCGKNFTQKGDLKKHLVIHTGVKPYECDVCGKAFSRSDHLAIHSVVHRC